MICRLFGFSATLDKQGQPRLLACRPLKEEKADIVEGANRHIAAGGRVPVMRDYHFRLMGIDQRLSARQLPIREAIRQALSEVLGYYAFRRPRKSG